MSSKNKNPRISNTENRDYILLGEVKNSCPVCGKKLLVVKGQKTIKQFEKAHIYPHSPTEQQQAVLKDIQPPKEIESLSNLIPLCKNCHTYYDSFTNIDEYLKMLSLKERLATEYSIKSELSEIPVESDINKVLKELETIQNEECLQLKIDPIPIESKISPGALRNKVLSLTTQYFQYLRTQFQHMESAQTHRFAKIASSFKLAYCSAAERSLLQEIVFDQLVIWLKNKTLGSTTACEVVVSYFIHDCEVFDEISK